MLILCELTGVFKSHASQTEHATWSIMEQGLILQLGNNLGGQFCQKFYMDVIYNFTYTCHLVVTNEFTCYLFNITNIHTRNFSIQLKQLED